MRAAGARSPAVRRRTAGPQRRAVLGVAGELASAAAVTRARLADGWPDRGHAAAVAGLAELVRGLESAAVAADRAAGATWEHIGAALGMSGDAARRRYG